MSSFDHDRVGNAACNNPTWVQSPSTWPTAGPRAGECYYQESCCNKAYKHPKAGQNEFDLSFWAYEQLAHPMYPEMMLEYRPVSAQPLRSHSLQAALQQLAR
jgi:hypothetical protein